MIKLLLLLPLLLIGILEAEALRGDTQEIIHEWQSFNKTITLHPQLATENRTRVIEEAVMSLEVIRLDDNLQHKGPKGIISDWYPGWNGALNSIKPTDLNFKVSSIPGDISITLLQSKSDVSGRAIQNGERVKIFIYEVDSYTLNSLQALVRHELGHAFGLGHSTAPEEMMFDELGYNNLWYPYISPCNILALSYNNMTEIRCEK